MEAYQELEHEFGRWVGLPHAVACSSGTAALHLAFEALGLPIGSAVLVPEFTMIACARAVVMAGLVPRFVDCGDDLLITVETLERAWTPDVRAVLPVHVYGRACDMPAICAWAQEKKLKVVEDHAEAHGIELRTERYRADAYCWSFYQNKIVAGEEGGLVAFTNSEHGRIAKCLRSQGFTPEHNFLHVPRGCNYRLSNANASLILDSLADVDSSLTTRAQLAKIYDDACPERWKMPSREVCWVYDVRIPGAGGIDKLVQALNAEGIAARTSFKPGSYQPEFRELNAHRTNAFRLSTEVLYLPVHPRMSAADALHNMRRLVDYV